jgi:hydrogenase-4 component B
MCLVASIPSVRVLGGGSPKSVRWAWDAPHGRFCVGLDTLSAFFLLPVVVLSTLAAIYGGSYLFAYRSRKSLASSWFFFNLFVLGMIMVVIARTALLFLLSWEVMSISAFFLVTFEHENADVRRAGWVYLIATHLGVAFLFATFVLLGRSAGSLEFEGFARMPRLDTFWSGLIFVLALIGFGAKAGFVPFHVWLPEAHPAAPSHVSALMSGVMIKMGLYGLLRVLTFLGAPAPWWGLLLASLGLLTALVGVSVAVQQRDAKRVLAYSSIENMGLIGVALGVSLWCSASAMPAVAALAMAAGLFHIWNHALMKSLMFLAAGSVLHATGTMDMEKLGGLMKRMPWTGAFMMVGALALSALPPLNGFVSEWLLYLSLMKCGLATTGGRGLTAFLAVGLVALVGGLAAITFVRLTGVVLLGSPRTEAAARAHESSHWMLAPMVILVVLCVTVAAVPETVAGLLPQTMNQLLGPGSGQAFLAMERSEAPLGTLGDLNAWTLIALGTAAAFLLALSRPSSRAEGPTWGCGYLTPTPRMQYTGRSFAEMIAEHILPRFLRPRTTFLPPRGVFPSRSEFGVYCPDPVSNRLYEPAFRRWADRCSQLRIIQQGKVHVYLVYVVLMVVLALAWVSIRR